jgi:hypothetical protein
MSVNCNDVWENQCNWHENHAKHRCTLCGQNIELLNGAIGGTYSYDCFVKCKETRQIQAATGVTYGVSQESVTIGSRVTDIPNRTYVQQVHRSRVHSTPKGKTRLRAAGSWTEVTGIPNGNTRLCATGSQIEGEQHTEWKCNRFAEHRRKHKTTRNRFTDLGWKACRRRTHSFVRMSSLITSPLRPNNVVSTLSLHFY